MLFDKIYIQREVIIEPISIWSDHFKSNLEEKNEETFGFYNFSILWEIFKLRRKNEETFGFYNFSIL